MAVKYFGHTPVSTHIEIRKPDHQKEYKSHFFFGSISKLIAYLDAQQKHSLVAIPS